MRTQQRGTIAFASPERFGDGVYNERTDMWAAGIVLYMLLYGQYPFEYSYSSSESKSSFEVLKAAPQMEPTEDKGQDLNSIDELVELVIHGQENI
jgi:serine/threonine protein kinase